MEEKTITLYVSEPFYDEMMDGDMMYDDMMMGDMMPEESGPGKGLIIGIIIAAVVLAGIGLGVFLTIRKKQKAAKLLADDLLDLEDEIKSDSDDKD